MTAQIRYGYADTPMGQIHYREMGSGPPVLLFHETPLSGATYEWALPFLAQHVRAIAPDTPGYGVSPPPPTPPPFPEYAERVGLLLDALELEKVVLIGGHTGSALALHIAVDMPERVAAVVALGCPLFTKEQSQAMLERTNRPHAVSKDGSHLSVMWDYCSRFLGPDASLEYYQVVSSAFMQTGPRYNWGFRAIFQFDLANLLPKVPCPTLFLVTEGDFLRDKNEWAVSLTPHGEGKVVDVPYGELYARYPEEFTREVVDYLRRVGYLNK